MPRKHRIKSDRNAAGKADLAAVSVSAQYEIEVGKGSLPINFWRV